MFDMSDRREAGQRRVGESIKSFRLEAGMNQTQLADRLGEALGVQMHKSAVSKIEAGQRGVSLEESVEIARILGVQVQQLADAYATDAQEYLWSQVEELLPLIAYRLETVADETHGTKALLDSLLQDPEWAVGASRRTAAERVSEFVETKGIQCAIMAAQAAELSRAVKESTAGHGDD